MSLRRGGSVWGAHGNNGGKGLPPPCGGSGGDNHRRPALPSPLALLSFARRLLIPPTQLEDDKRLILFKSEKARRIYRRQYPYLIFLANPEEKRILDVRIVKTYTTLKDIDKDARSKGQAILLHPQPIAIPKGFWSEWKKAIEPRQRIELVRKHGLAKDERIFVLARILIDIDQPYESAEPLVLKVFEKLGIDRGYALGKTKSGNLRGVLWLEPLVVEQKEVFNGKQVTFTKEFYLRPNTKHNNGHTHYQNFREYLAILYGLLEKEGLKVDWTFFDRVNHPIWYSLQDTKFFSPVRTQEGSLKFYELYSKAKELQAKEKLWELPKRGQPFNLTKHFWSIHWKERKIQMPAFVRNEFDSLIAWQKAVESLARKHTSGRFLKVITPAVGWAKYLGLSEIEVESFLKRLLADKRNVDRDLRIALKWAKPLTFGKPDTPRTLDFSKYLDYTLNYILSKGGQVKRQELLREVFQEREWLLDQVMNYLEKKGFVESSIAKENRRGRPSKVYILGKGLAFPSKTCPENQPEGGKEFTHIITSLGEAVHVVDCLVEVGITTSKNLEKGDCFRGIDTSRDICEKSKAEGQGRIGKTQKKPERPEQKTPEQTTDREKTTKNKPKIPQKRPQSQPQQKARDDLIQYVRLVKHICKEIGKPRLKVKASEEEKLIYLCRYRGNKYVPILKVNPYEHGNIKAFIKHVKESLQAFFEKEKEQKTPKLRPQGTGKETSVYNQIETKGSLRGWRPPLRPRSLRNIPLCITKASELKQQIESLSRMMPAGWRLAYELRALWNTDYELEGYLLTLYLICGSKVVDKFELYTGQVKNLGRLWWNILKRLYEANGIKPRMEDKEKQERKRKQEEENSISAPEANETCHNFRTERQPLKEEDYLNALTKEYKRLRKEYWYRKEHITYYYDTHRKEWELKKDGQTLVKIPIASGLSIEECLYLLRKGYEEAFKHRDDFFDF